VKVGVLGASGYAGQELLRLLGRAEQYSVSVAQGSVSAGTALAELAPGLGSLYPALRLSGIDASACDGLDLVLCALPSGVAQDLMPDLVSGVGHVVDLSGDFRLKDPALYQAWYGFTHRHPELLAESVYGLPELGREELAGARLVAAPGCYVTAAALVLAPLVRSGLLAPEACIVDGASGLSGAGRELTRNTHYVEAAESYSAYSLLEHRHTPEMEQVIGTEILFTPHLVPMRRGLYVTCYARPCTTTSTPELLEILATAYKDEPFVRVVKEPPRTAATYGSNSCEITARYDSRTGAVLALASLDNLGKGAAGQALQAANLAVGLAETTGLSRVGLPG